MNLVGRLGKDPEVKKFGEKTLVTFSMATNKKRGDEETTSWFNIKAWGFAAEKSANFKKGERVIVECTDAEEEKWVDKKTGENKSKIVFTIAKAYSLNPKLDNKEWVETGDSTKAKQAEEPPVEIPF